MSCEDLCIEMRWYIYVSLRGQVRARCHAYAQPSHNNARSQCRDRLYSNAKGRSYRPSTGIDDLRVAGARELLRYLSVPRLY